MSGNEFTGEHFELMRISMASNKCLTSLDMRRNPGCTDGKDRHTSYLLSFLICLYEYDMNMNNSNQSH